MKYKLIIDQNVEEEIIAIVHAPSSLTQQVENLVCSFSGTDSIMGYRDDGMRKLAFKEIECITILERKVTVIVQAMRKVITLVLPVPAPASTNTGPLCLPAAAACSGLS